MGYLVEMQYILQYYYIVQAVTNTCFLMHMTITIYMYNIMSLLLSIGLLFKTR